MGQDSVVTAILAALERDPDINLHEFRIRVTLNEVLRLEGEVQDIIAKRKALRIAARVAHTESIDDRLCIRPGSRRGDADVLNSALNALGQESAFRDVIVRLESENGLARDQYGIEIAAQEGVIKLTGTVGSLSHRRLAEVIAWWVPGSRDVDNRLHVHPREQETDDEISDIVRLVLDKDPSLDSGQIHITTRDRVVTLDGFVHSQEIKHIAAEDCWYIPGIHDVHNRIQVRPR